MNRRKRGLSKGPRLPGTLLKELGSTGGGHGRRDGERRKRRVRGSGGPTATTKRGRHHVSKFDEIVPAVRGRSVDETIHTPDDPELVLQRKLAKKLGLKSTRLAEGQDGLDDLLQEFDDVMAGEPSDSSDFDHEEEEEESSLLLESSEESEESEEPVKETKYIPPALRSKQALQGDEQEMAVQKRVRGLINRVAEANLEGIVSELSDMYKNEGRTYVSQSLSHELITAAADGPRASERFAIVAATCVASLAASTESSEVIATFLSRVGMALEKALSCQDSVSCSNLVRLLGCLFLAKAIKPDIMFDILNSWSEKFSDEHVVSIAGLLTVAGLALRKADPTLMKDFVVSIHDKASHHGTITTRARVMLDLVVDIKNNRMKARKGALSISTNGSATIAHALPPNVSHWFKSQNVDAVAVGGISWNKVIDPHSKKGFWWIPTLQDTVDKQHQECIEQDVVPDSGDANLLALASKLRMSTETRKSIFLAVMGGEDAVDAAEKLLRLNLQGQQEREIVRVTMECSLHEAAYNQYYGLLLSRLCQLAKGHRVTLQYCIWDHIKDCDRMNARKIAIFSKLAAFVVTSKALPLASIVKVASFSSSEMSAKELLLWRQFFKSLLEGAASDGDLKAVLTKLVEQKEHASVKRQVRNFLKTRIGPWLATKENVSLALTRCNKAERYLTK